MPYTQPIDQPVLGEDAVDGDGGKDSGPKTHDAGDAAPR